MSGLAARAEGTVGASLRPRASAEVGEAGSAGDAAVGGAAAVRVVICEDHPLFREALGAMLGEHGLVVVGSAGRGDELIALVEHTRPELVLLDIALPGLDGLTCLELLRERFPAVKAIIVSADDRPAVVDQALALGAAGFVAKSVAPDNLAAAVALVAHDSPLTIPPSNLASAAAASPLRLPEPPALMLTKREREILNLVNEGQTNGQIARRLWVTEQTVKFHLSNAYRKLEVDNRTQASAKARQLGILAPQQHTA